MTDGPVPSADLINRFSSRRQRLDHAFLADRLRNAKSYRRIAGYFRSSIFELVGEEIASIPDVRILCNSELDHADIAISKALREQSLKEKWNGVAVETEALLHREQYRRLHESIEFRAGPDPCRAQRPGVHSWHAFTLKSLSGGVSMHLMINAYHETLEFEIPEY